MFARSAAVSQDGLVRIGVISDTHDHLANVGAIVALLNDVGVERVVHTGDITKAKTLEALARLDAPLFGVYGNNDRERSSLEAAALQHGFHLVEPPLELHWAGRRLVVVHDPLELDGDVHHRYDVVLHGHNHRRILERRGDALIFNPGECAGFLKGHNAVGLVDLLRLEAEVVLF
jgi:putative phosphoesterase